MVLFPTSRTRRVVYTSVMIEKRCPDCEKMLPIEDFYLRTDAKYRSQLAQHRCKKCQSKYQIERRRISKRRAVEYLGGGCQMCGYNRCDAALDFHHRDPTTKTTRAALLTSLVWEKVLEEIKKCDLLCSNCHREVEVGFHR